MANTKIEWAEKVWNPVTGCSKISPGCANCYAERMTKRLQAMGQARYKDGFAVRCQPEALDEPLRWRKPSKIFVCSMADLFHDDVPFEFIQRVLRVIWHSHIHNFGHTFMILTKRPERMKEFFSSKVYADSANSYHLPKNLWLGVTAENQDQADKRIPILLQIPAAVRFVSVEPMLGPVDLWAVKDGSWYDSEGADYYNALNGYSFWAEGDHGLSGGPKLNWVICGGESGPGARPMHPDWARSLRDQCQAAGVPFLFKQWGEWVPMPCIDSVMVASQVTEVEGQRMCRVGKKKAGRLLDGKIYDECPSNKKDGY